MADRYRPLQAVTGRSMSWALRAVTAGSTLWQDVIISTDPATVSVGMFSWFPLYMPLRHPVFVPDGGRVEARAAMLLELYQPPMPVTPTSPPC